MQNTSTDDVRKFPQLTAGNSLTIVSTAFVIFAEQGLKLKYRVQRTLKYSHKLC